MKPTYLIASLSLMTSAVWAGAKHSAIEPIMVTVPAGKLDMQTGDGESHLVELPEFSIGKYEVTVAEFRQFIEATNYSAPTECRHEMDTWFLMFTKGNWETNALNTSEYQPVVCINWNAANAYAEWLAEVTGKPYRLPSESEWEYAASAGTKTDYYFGDDPQNNKVCDYENTGDIYGENILQRNHNTSYHNWTGEVANCNDYSGYASIVGMYKANPFGLHDTISNVVEFLADCHTADVTQLPKDGSAFVSQDCERRARRGASWHWSHWPLRNRGSSSMDFAGGVDGFRLALDGKAPKHSKNTKHFIKGLKFAQQQEQKRRDSVAPIPQPVKNLTLSEDNGVIVLNWEKSEKDSKETYRVYKNDVNGKMFRLHATNLFDTQYIDASPDSHGYEYTVVAVKKHMQSHYAPAVAKTNKAVVLPGQVEAEWLKSIEGAAVSYTSDETTRARLGFNLSGRDGISDTARMDYQVEVNHDGLFKFDYRVATPRDTKGFKLLLNGKELALANVTSTGGYHEWQTQGGLEVNLPKGKHTLTIESLDNNWKLNWFQLNKI